MLRSAERWAGWSQSAGAVALGALVLVGACAEGENVPSSGAGGAGGSGGTGGSSSSSSGWSSSSLTSWSTSEECPCGYDGCCCACKPCESLGCSSCVSCSMTYSKSPKDNGKCWPTNVAWNAQPDHDLHDMCTGSCGLGGCQWDRECLEICDAQYPEVAPLWWAQWRCPLCDQCGEVCSKPDPDEDFALDCYEFFCTGGAGGSGQGGAGGG